MVNLIERIVFFTSNSQRTSSPVVTEVNREVGRSFSCDVHYLLRSLLISSLRSRFSTLTQVAWTEETRGRCDSGKRVVGLRPEGGRTGSLRSRQIKKEVICLFNKLGNLFTQVPISQLHVYLFTQVTCLHRLPVSQLQKQVITVLED